MKIFIGLTLAAIAGMIAGTFGLLSILAVTIGQLGIVIALAI